MYQRYCELRDKKGVSDCEVSRATGITRSTFTDWKSGRSKPGFEKIVKLARFFGVAIEYFVEE